MTINDKPYLEGIYIYDALKNLNILCKRRNYDISKSLEGEITVEPFKGSGISWADLQKRIFDDEVAGMESTITLKEIIKQQGWDKTYDPYLEKEKPGPRPPDFDYIRKQSIEFDQLAVRTLFNTITIHDLDRRSKKLEQKYKNANSYAKVTQKKSSKIHTEKNDLTHTNLQGLKPKDAPTAKLVFNSVAATLANGGNFEGRIQYGPLKATKHPFWDAVEHYMHKGNIDGIGMTTNIQGYVQSVQNEMKKHNSRTQAYKNLHSFILTSS